MRELDRPLEDYEADIRFGEASPKPKARSYEEARITEEPEFRNYKETNRANVLVDPEKAREARTSSQDKSFDSAKIEKRG